MRYDTILFDIDDTLIDFIRTFKGAAREVLLYGGYAHPTDEDLETYYVENNKIWFSTDLEESNREEICAIYHPRYEKYLYDTQLRMKELFGLTPAADELNERMLMEMGKNASVNPHVEELLAALKPHYKLGIASNGLSRLQRYKLERFQPFMTYIFISEEIDAVKPQQQYFERILRDTGDAPNRILMVGDSLQNDIGGAQTVGMDTCYYNPHHNTDLKGIVPTYEIQDFAELIEILCCKCHMN